MITLVLLALLAAIANVLDTFTDIVAITKGGITPAVFGALNSLSYVIFLFTIIIAGRVAERGVLRAQILIYCIILLVYFSILNVYVGQHIFVLLIALYGVYPILQAVSRVTVTAYIHENYRSDQWSKLLSRRVITTLIFEALIMLSLSLNINNVLSMGFPSMLVYLIPAVTTLLVIKDPAYRFEKPLFRIEAGLRRIENIVMDTIRYTIITKGDGWRYNSRGVTLLLSKRRLSPSIAMISTIIFRLSSALLLIQLPVYLIRSLSYTSFDILVVYSIAKSILLIDFIIPVTLTRNLLSMMLTRALLPFGFLFLGGRSNYLYVAIPLGLIFYLNNKIDIALYSHYIEALGRPESTRFILIGETTGFIATLVSGLMIGVIGYEGIVYLTAVLLVLGGLMLKL